MGTKEASSSDGHQTVRGDGDCEHRCGWEPGVSDMANIIESLIKIVITNRQKVLICLNQNGERPGSGAMFSSDADVAPSV
ncbi:hypothetical protein MTBBW1_2830004 [Desulfamplus magnetovallimortis]|uniref:Uncharacterized protein n=1 Tax=Desulfamplus magnetovallimortis TaxID=1246637 RepID=A0A1W1HFL4_9BACT|nr:hypothetical protein MTBBW1_2830004 [Desulfamplus magnetovallimortis]